MKKSKLIAILLMVTFGIAGCVSFFRSQQKDPPLQVYSIIEKKYVSLPEANSHEPSLVVFWTTWCSPCRLEMARLQRAIQAGKIPSGKIHAVNLGEPIETVEAFALSSDLQFQFFADPDERNMTNYSVTGTPTIYYFNQQGRVIEATTGIDPKSIEKAEALFHSTEKK